MIRMIRSAILVLVLAHLVASAAFALPYAAPRTLPALTLTDAWGWVISLFTPVSPAAKSPHRGIMTKAGTIMDPNGEHLSGTIWSGSITDLVPEMDLGTK